LWVLPRRGCSQAYIGKPYGPICASELEGLTFLLADSSDISDLTGLEYCTGLEDLFLGRNQIRDLSPLAGMTGLGYLHLSNNQISDIEPMLENSGIGSDDYVDLSNNPLNETSCTVYIAELQSRGVWVEHSCHTIALPAILFPSVCKFLPAKDRGAPLRVCVVLDRKSCKGDSRVGLCSHSSVQQHDPLTVPPESRKRYSCPF